MPRVARLSMCYGVFGLGLLYLSPIASAQSITASDGRTQIDQTGGQYDISGGVSSDDGQNLFHSFGQFGLSAGELANFLTQPDVLNVLARINGGDASIINGTLQVTGSQANLYLLNPSGVLFGPDVILNLPGNLTATTANGIGFGNGSFDALGDDDYALLTGSPQTLIFAADASGAVVNAGDLQLDSGRSLLLAGSTVLNTGTVTVPGGEVAIAAVPDSQLVRLSPTGSLLSYDIAPDTANPSFTALSLPELLTGSGLDTGATVENGSVQVAQVAIPTEVGTVIVTGQLDVSGPEGGTLTIVGDTTGAIGALLTAAGTDADGANSVGGNVYIGGSRTGDGPLPNATVTYLDADSVVDVSGQNTGGEIIVWADQSTRIDGQLLARGDQQGGFIETSSLGDLSVTQTPDISSAAGNAGTWLVDPLNLTIGTEDNLVTGVSPFEPTGAGARLAVDTILGALNAGGNVVVTTTDTVGADAGDILVEAQIDTSLLTQAASLSLEAAGSIILEAPIAPDTTPIFPLTLRLIADADNTGDGQISIAGLDAFTAIDTTGGDLTLQGNTRNLPGVNAISLTGDFAIQTDGGNILMTGTAGSGSGVVIGPDVFIDTGGGDFTVVGSSDSGTGIDIDGFIDVFGGFFLDGVTGDIVLNGSSPILGVLVESRLSANNITVTSDSDIIVDVLNADINVVATAAQFFQATGIAVLGEVGPEYSVFGGNAVTITHGGDGVVPFTVGDSKPNGTEAAIRTGTNAIEPDQSFLDSEVQGNIAILTGETEPELPPSTETVPNCVVDCSVPPTFSNGNRPRITTDQGDAPPPLVVINTDTRDVFNKLVDREGVYTEDFIGYLGLNEEDFPKPDLPALQEYLRQVAEATGIAPALLYVSFVPEGEVNFENETSQSEIQASLPSAPQAGNKSANHSQELSQFFDPGQASRPDDILELILVTPDQPPIRKTVSVSQQQVRRVAAQFRGEVTNRARVGSRTYLRPAQQLHSWLLDPMADILTEAEIGNIAFIMPPQLRSLPVSALHDGESFIIERYSVGLMPSVSLTDLRYVDVRDSEVLAMGASSFADQPALPAVPVELQAIADRIWPGKFLLNETFTPDLLVSNRQQTPYGIVHLATHGEFKSGSLNNSYIQFWDQRMGLDQVRTLGLNSPPVELMVLSACRTALGNEEAELGFAGMAVQSGVKTAMASLWKVDDVGTAGIMTQFYSSLRDEPIKAEALRQAQLAMIQGDIRVKGAKMAWSGGEIDLPDQLKDINSDNFDHPFFWAAFTTIGSPW